MLLLFKNESGCVLEVSKRECGTVHATGKRSTSHTSQKGTKTRVSSGEAPLELPHLLNHAKLN